MNTSLVITVIGADRPGIVRMLADRGRAFDANWAESRMASLAGQFAGIIRWEVPAGKAEAMDDRQSGLKNRSRRGNEADGCARLPEIRLVTSAATIFQTRSKNLLILIPT